MIFIILSTGRTFNYETCAVIATNYVTLAPIIEFRAFYEDQKDLVGEMETDFARGSICSHTFCLIDDHLSHEIQQKKKTNKLN